jgi:hypothetical protein
VGFVVTCGAEEVLGNTMFQRLGVPVGKLLDAILFFLAQIIPALELDPALRTHQALLSFFHVLQVGIPFIQSYRKAPG